MGRMGEINYWTVFQLYNQFKASVFRLQALFDSNCKHFLLVHGKHLSESSHMLLKTWEQRKQQTIKHNFQRSGSVGDETNRLQMQLQRRKI